MAVGNQGSNDGFGLLGWLTFAFLLLGFAMALYFDQLTSNGGRLP